MELLLLLLVICSGHKLAPAAVKFAINDNVPPWFIYLHAREDDVDFSSSGTYKVQPLGQEQSREEYLRIMNTFVIKTRNKFCFSPSQGNIEY